MYKKNTKLIRIKTWVSLKFNKIIKSINKYKKFLESIHQINLFNKIINNYNTAINY